MLSYMEPRFKLLNLYQIGLPVEATKNTKGLLGRERGEEELKKRR